MNLKKYLGGYHRLFACILSLFVAAFFSSMSYATEGHEHNGDHEHNGGHGKPDQFKFIQGEVSTGANIMLGEPISEFPQPWGRLAESVVGVYNPDGENPFPLTPSTPLDSILASSVPQPLIDEFPLTSPHNVPLHETLTSVTPSLELGTLPENSDAAVDEASSSRQPVTLGDWLAASGMMEIKCFEDGAAKLEMKVEGLIPNGLYTLWQTRGTSDGSIAAVPAGGIPNVLVPNETGEATYSRDMGVCPLVENDGEPVIMYELAYHSDARIHGGVPDLPTLGFPFGWGTHTQITFPVRLEGD